MICFPVLRYLRVAATATACGLLLAACTTKSMRRVRLMSDITAEGKYAEGIEKIRKSPRLYGKLNRFLYWFDQGVLFHYLQEFDSSLVHLEKAEAVVDELFARSITNEAASLLTNDNLRPYRPKRYEQILLHQLLASNYLAKDEFDEALVETRKVQLVFDRFKSKDKGRDKYNDDGMSHYLSSIVYDALGERDNADISLYKSVRAYTDGPVGLPADVRDVAFYRFEDHGREGDIKELELTKPAGEAESVHGLQGDETEIVLIGYAGKGPILGETMFWGTYVVGGVLIAYYRNAHGDTVALALPAPPFPDSEEKRIAQGRKTSSGRTYHIKFSLPEVVTRESRTVRFAAQASSGREVKSTLLSDTDLLLERDHEDNHGKTVARTALRTVMRTIAAEKTKSKLASESPLVNLLVGFGTDILADQLEKADTRLCFLLPGAVHIVRIPVEPGAHRVEAHALGRGGKVVGTRAWDNITVKKGEKKFLFYPSLE